MDKVVLQATRRTVTGKQVKALRRQGLLPAVMYGTGIEPMSFSLNAHDTAIRLAGVSSSTLVYVNLDGTERATLVREKQKDYIKNSLLHIDFQVVSLTEKIRSKVLVETHGTAPAIETYNAVMIQNLNEIEVEALPQDLPERIVVDLGTITEIGNAIHVRDLAVSDKVTVLTSGDEIVVVATGAAPEIVEEVEAVDEAAEPEVIERGKREEGEDE